MTHGMEETTDARKGNIPFRAFRFLSLLRYLPGFEQRKISFRSSAEALQELAWDPRFVGGQIGMIGVLHTWERNLSYHPHVHYLVPAGGLSAKQDSWLPSRRNFLIPVKAAARLFRAKFRDALKKAGLFDLLPGEI